MKILKYLFFLFLIVIIAGAIYVATQDGEYHIEETTVLDAPVSVIFNEVNNLENWGAWGPWRSATEDEVIEYKKTTRGEGAGFEWKSEELGDGSITTTNVLPENSIEQQVIHNPTFAESQGRMYWKFEEVEEGTRVTLGLQGSQSFKEKLAFAFRDNSITDIIRPRLSSGLQKLDSTVQNRMSQYTINVDGITTHGGGFYMYSTTASKISQVPVRMENMITEVKNYMEMNNIPQLGDPFVVYNNWDEQNNSAIYSAGIFTPSLVITPQDSDILNAMMPVQKVVKATLKGDYKNLEEAWDSTYSYLEKNNLRPDENRQPFEVFRTDPETTPNPADWVTEIYIPIATETPTDIQI